MPTFRYVAVDPAGQTVHGTMEAATEAEVVARLQRSGSIPMRAEPAQNNPAARLLSWKLGRRNPSRAAVTAMTRELAVMLTAGQDLDRSLRFIVDSTPDARVSTTMDAVRQIVRDGGSLATALSAHPGVFSRLYVSLVRAGEAGGTLAPTLERLASLLERERALSSTVISALIYPALLVLVAIGSVVLLLTQVLPQFVPMFEQSGAALPRPTQMLIAAGDAVSGYGLYALLVMLAGSFLLRQVLRRPEAKLACDRLQLRVPILGVLLKEVLAARFSRTLGTLLGNGVPLIAALGIAREVLGNAAAAAAVERAALVAKGGAGLSGALAETGVFPARTINLLRLGEETAQLGVMALRAADIHEEKARLNIGRLVSLLVPAITVTMGAVIAGIVSALLLAMLGLNDLAAG